MYHNQFDQPLIGHCGKNQAVYRIQSYFSNIHKDRRYRIYCKSIVHNRCNAKCWKSNYVNSYRQHIAFNCPPNYYLSGMESVHSNRMEDRIWKFRCCYLPKYVTSNCGLTGYINYRYYGFNYMVGLGKVVVGMHSYWKQKYVTIII